MKIILVFPGWEKLDYYKLLYKGMKEVCYASYSGATFALTKNIRRHKPQAIHLHWIADYLALNKKWSLEFLVKLVVSLIDILVVRLIYQIPIIWTIHNLYEHESRHVRAERVIKTFLGKMSRDVIVMGEIGKEVIHNEFKIKKSKIQIIPHGTFENIYPKSAKTSKEIKSKLKVPHKNLVYLMAGSVKKYKGAKNAIQSFKMWNEPNTTLIIAGKFDNDQKELLKNTTEKIMLIDKYLTEIELVDFYKCCDWVVAPYENIFTSGTIACAIGYNKPIIAPKIGLIPNYVSSQSGILYNNNDKYGLLSALKNSMSFLKSNKKYYSTEFHKSLDWNLIRKKTKIVLFKNEK